MNRTGQGHYFTVGKDFNRGAGDNAAAGGTIFFQFQESLQFFPTVRFAVCIAEHRGNAQSVEDFGGGIVIWVGPADPFSGQHDTAGGNPEKRLALLI